MQMKPKQTNTIHPPTPWLALALQLLFLLSAVSGCHFSTSRTAEHDDAALDSAIRQKMGTIYADPVRARRSLDSLAHTLADTAQRLRVELYAAVAQDFGGDTAGAAHVRNRIIDWCRRNHGHEAIEGLAWNHKGVSRIRHGDFSRARDYFAKACRLLQAAGEKEGLVNAYINLADANLHSGHLPQAATYYRRAHFIADSCGLNDLLPPINSGLGQVYVMIDNYKEANRYLDAAEAGIHQEPDNSRLFFYTTRGNCYFFEKRYAEALSCFRKALRLAEGMNAPDLVAQTYGNIGETLLRQGQTARAAVAITKGVDYVRANPEANPSMRFYLFSLALEAALDNNRLDIAERLLEHDIDTANVDDPRYLALHYDRLRRYAEKRHNWQEAYRCIILAQHYEDVLRNQQVFNNIEETRLRYEQDTTLMRQRIVIADYRAKTSRQQAWIVGITGGLIILALGIIVIVTLGHRRAERRHRSQVQQMARLRMNIVQNRMQPHYVFNVLGTILPRFSRYPELSKTIGLLIDVLRSNLVVAGKTAISIGEEYAIVDKYIRLYHLVNGGKPKVCWHMSEPLPQLLIPTMSLQIPIENALKHAFPTLTDDSRIDVHINCTPTHVVLRIEDNGAGYNPGNIPKTGRDTGTGLLVLARTIQVLNGHNAEKASFDIANREDACGTVVRMEVPVRYNWNI